MAQIKERGRRWEWDEWRLEFTYRADLGRGASFPCDEYGNVNWEMMRTSAREHYQMIVADPSLVFIHGPRAYREYRQEPDVFFCPGDCGGEVEAFRSYDVDYCLECVKRLEAEFPQGWKHYPGDVCPHGVYVGGCGVDWMCSRCEGGE